MLHIEISPKAPKPVITYTPKTYPITPVEKPNVIFTTAFERDKVIKELYSSCKYKVGDAVKDKQDNRYIVHHICQSYAELGGSKGDWPANNNPMIVTICTPEGVFSFCTTNYVEKV